MSCGQYHMLAIAENQGGNGKKDGSTYSWGRNYRGQLGIGSKENRYSPAII